MFHGAQTIPTLFHTVAQTYTTRTALRVRKAGKLVDISWRLFYEQVVFCALGLYALGVRARDTVCIIAENRAEWLYTDLAVLTNRAVIVPLYTNCSDHDFRYIVSHCDAKYLVVSQEEFLEKFKRVHAMTPVHSLRTIIAFDDTAPVHGRAIVSFPSLIKDGKDLYMKNPGLFTELIAQGMPQDIATIIYTSGTTGDPKGVLLSHQNFIENCRGCSRAITVTERDVSLSFLPLSHVFERLAGYYFFLFSGATIAFAENMFAVIKNIREVQPTVMCAVPRFFERVYHGIFDQIEKKPFLARTIFQWGLRIGRLYHTFKRRGRTVSAGVALVYYLYNTFIFKKLRKHVGGNIRFFISGGAALSKEIAYFFEIIGITILEGYGLTETAPVVSVNTEERNKIGTVGFPLENLAVRIADDGEILVKGPSVMCGYFKDQRATGEVLRGDWLYTGDIGKIDSDGYLRIIDRKKDIIVLSGGKNVSPQRIETALIADKLFNQVVVYGDEQKHLVALIVPDRNQLELFATNENIAYSCSDDLFDHPQVYALFKKRINAILADFAAYEKIKNFKLLHTEFTLDNGELTPTFKIRRRVIYQRYKQILATLY